MPDAFPQLIAIAAMASNRVIGRQGQLPWHLPGDLKFFKETTLNHTVLMGRVTYESIIASLGKPLPKRRNIVLSRTMDAAPVAGVEVIHDIEDLPRLGSLTNPVYLVGGAQLYAALLPRCAELYLTCLREPYEGDAFFPPFEEDFDLKDIMREEPEFEIRRYVRKTPTHV